MQPWSSAWYPRHREFSDGQQQYADGYDRIFGKKPEDNDGVPVENRLDRIQKALLKQQLKPTENTVTEAVEVREPEAGENRKVVEEEMRKIPGAWVTRRYS